MRQRKFGRHPDVLFGHGHHTAPGGVRNRGAGHHKVRAHTVDIERGAHRGDPIQLGVVEDDVIDQTPGLGNAECEVVVRLSPAAGEIMRVGLVAEPPADHLGADRDVTGGRDINRQSEPIQ